MRTPVRTLLATVVCTLPALSQSTVAEKHDADTEKLWRIQVTAC